MMQGAIQVNTEGRRFSNEMGGYSEQAVKVIGQPGGIAWNIFDKARHDFAVAGFPDYLDAVDAARSVQVRLWRSCRGDGSSQ